MSGSKSELEQILPFLEYVSKLSKFQQKKLLAQADSKIVKILTNLCYNFNKGHITTDPKHIKRLKPYKKLIKTLCQKRLSLKKRHKILQTGGFLSTLLSTTVPLLLQFLTQK